MNKVGILIDSCCEFDEKWLKKINGDLVPLVFSDGNGKTYNDDKIEITRDILFDKQSHGLIFKSASTPLGILMDKITDLLKTNHHVVYFPVSSGLSTQFSNGKLMEEEFGDKLVVVKTASAVAVNKWIIDDFVKNINSGVEILEAKEIAEEEYKNTATLFSLDKVEGLARSGRGTKLIIDAMKVLKLKPIIELYTKIHFGGIGKKFENIIDRMIKKIKKIWGNAKLNSDSITNVAILDGGIEKSKLQIIKNKLISAFGIKSEKIENVYFPLIVLIHTLKGAYGIQIKSNMKREILKWED